ncbi:acyl-CoA thioester hydrolase [Variovorax sp. OK605]|jgi:acyl-CoA thioester hydrolase|uniref:tol-pal system-associated acyl-CoA thioesterase n=1 Tax=unclassified Variovorax TaxID=663243 RepID=UPI0008BED8C9|nr:MULTISPECIES: tol-pal system-associated acyl-CoA thioesterase [unclassified Variovorax]SEK02589.1 acyl-CoA thioester hydrolase [Variovorax sp. OK202]SFD34376.1 acyl-CoA thioester hydrolase [Variovorax sp. OK212]SFP73385.1 acyl-CoA thioester hydrolase [Variovorax sp. OK605]
MSYAFPIRVYWEDTDAGGIVFYANYLKFMERGRTEWLRSLGVEQRKLREETGGQFVVSETKLKYHRPSRLDDELLVTADLQQMGTASLIIGQRVLSKTEQERTGASAPVLLCEGTIRIGWVDAATLRPARIPKQVTGTLERYSGSMTQPIKP